MVPTATLTWSYTPSASRTLSSTPTATALGTSSGTHTSTPTPTPTPSGSQTGSCTGTATHTLTPTASPTRTRSPTATPSASATPSATGTSSATPTLDGVPRVGIAPVPLHNADRPLHLHALIYGPGYPRVEGCTASRVVHSDWALQWTAATEGVPAGDVFAESRGAGTLVVTVPPHRLTNDTYDFTLTAVSAQYRSGGRPVVRTVTVRTAINRPPLHSGPGPALRAVTSAGAAPALAWADRVTLSTPPEAWTPYRPDGAPLAFRFAFAVDGREFPLPDAPGFQPSPTVTVWVPWVPSPAAQLAAVFRVYVRDAHGAEAGPYSAPAAVAIRAPALARPPPYAPAGNASVPCLGAPCASGPLAGPGALLQLLGHAVGLADRCEGLGPHGDLATTLGVLARTTEGTPTAALPVLGRRVAPLHSIAKALALCPDAAPVAGALLQAVDAVVYREGPPPSGTALQDVLSLVSAVNALWLSSEACSFTGIAFQTPHVAMTVWRGPPTALPTSLHAGPAAVHLPPDVARALGGAVAGDYVDVVVRAVRAGPFAASDVVTVDFSDPQTGRVLEVADLQDPVTLRLAARVPAAAPASLYRCMYDVGGEWDASGLWLDPGDSTAEAFTCRTLHLSTFVVLGLASVESVGGCPVAAPPTALYCPVRATTALTVAGFHFGPAGADVAIAYEAPPTSGAAAVSVRCGAVRHAPGREESQVVCSSLTGAAPGPGLWWAAVTVSTASGQNSTLSRAVLFVGPPATARIEPLTADCIGLGPSALVECPPHGASFLLHGLGFQGVGATGVTVGPYVCPDVRVLNDTALACHGVQGVGRMHAVAVTVGGLQSPTVPAPLTLSFGDPCKDKTPGHWAGAECGECAAAWYGPQCAVRCPGTADGATGRPPVVCSGHGLCDAGQLGLGACTCDRNGPTGYWAGTGCDVCAAGYYGTDCRSVCPSAVLSGLVPLSCSGRGVCADGRTGDGACACTAGYGGAACELQCPVALGTNGTKATCGAHGVCETAGGGTSAGVCRCYRGAATGFWDGDACGRCWAPYVGPGCRTACPAGEGGVPCAGHGSCRYTGGAAVCECEGGYVGAGCTLPCPLDATDAECSGHGSCVVAGGAAMCQCARSDAEGHWMGTACGGCAPDYRGAQCTVPCPKHPNTRMVCGGHGTCLENATCHCSGGYCGSACDVSPAECAAQCPAGAYGPLCAGQCACGPQGKCLDGRHGSGACVCASGWAGPTCELLCEGGPAAPCSLHGQCQQDDGTCVCDTGWRSLPGTPACSVPCPGLSTGSPCSGHGTCGVAAQCTCSPGYGGAECAAACPVADGVVCGGRGVCRAEDGACACAADGSLGFWTGAACDACTAGYHGPACTAPCLHGASLDRACVCHSGWVGANCSRECAGGAAQPCTGHGRCDAATGDCACDSGYAGVDCALTCAGGAASPCSGRGTCRPADGTCECQDDALGHWAGPACGDCKPPYFGADCRLACPADAGGTACGGHGVCAGSGECVCDQDALAGHWDGPACAACSPGHFGAACRAVCPGGACAPCSGHGVCHDGVAGNGTCACVAGPATGFFTGAACDRCLPGYYSNGCLMPCPGGAASPCGGHGACDDGRRGSGRCACVQTEAAGFWAGDACGSCREGYYGQSCRAACPGQAQGAACLGHGTCDGGRGGSGQCQCLAGYVGAACEAPCPRHEGRVCNAAGVCTEAGVGVAACVCFRNASHGAFAGAACGQCRSGYYGPRCARQCPGQATNASCGGHGVCDDGPRGGGACSCQPGWAGADCARPCPGLEDGSLCGGRGVCNVSTAVCACAQSDSEGHWGAPDCLTCAAGWSGVNCTLPCPRDDGGTALVCSGHGTCADGACVACTGGYCGGVCELPPAQCAPCPTGTWGPGCGRVCPGGRAVPCSGHGQCDESMAGTGRCICVTGWVGVACALQCAGGAANPCSGHGVCDLATGACACAPRWRGASCSMACPESGGLVCGGVARGVCSVEGNCACVPGFAGVACSLLCPGPLGAPCHGHGTCGLLGECACVPRWGGLACDACAVGWVGAACDRPCINGVAAGGACACNTGFVGDACDLGCPGGSLRVCAGHGTCYAAVGAALCQCLSGWGGAQCDVECPGGGGSPCSGHGVCGPDGRCTCVASTAAGNWTGVACDRCAEGWLGVSCTQRCPMDAVGRTCGGRGACTGDVPVCVCASDAATGYFTGPLCGECQPGHYGAACLDECPGGACKPCHGHGTCTDGMEGNGTCTCLRHATLGHFAGLDCSRCAPGFFSQTCTVECPGGAANPCHGHGACDAGTQGTGACACHGDEARGYWTGEACLQCWPLYYGADCRRACPTDKVANAVCAGHGLCLDGITGTGACACDAGYIGAACEVPCPGVQGVPCSGHGACAPSAGGAACVCTATEGEGFWTGALCDDCRPGYAGPACATPCLDCSGHGACLGGRNSSGRCACDYGWGGRACDVECPGGARFPCSLHGACLADGACECYRDAVNGYWTGDACEVCLAGYDGDACLASCELGPNGQMCSGRGKCHHFQCLCEAGSCGRACERAGPECLSIACPLGVQGIECLLQCPGVDLQALTVCTGHGLCLNVTEVDSGCLCDVGWSDRDCSVPCPGTPVCMGRGACNDNTTGCECRYGFGGVGCEDECPGGWGTPCTGHGWCATLPGGGLSCACDAGHRGAACQLSCPGLGSPAGVCAGHGACGAAAACACDAHWAGGGCEDCGQGWYGPRCDLPCVQGTSVGRACVCHSGWVGPGCAAQCQGGWRDPCSGHGTCNGTSTGDGACVCGMGWVGAACALPCPKVAGLVCAGHGQCRPDATCACVAGTATGHWAGAACQSCAVGWLGPQCTVLCPTGPNSTELCGGHGQCDPLTYLCRCAADGAEGYWDPEGHCTRCLQGYFGPKCTGLCPGAGCNLCSGHGRCNDGRQGDGLCACDAEWQGLSCAACAAGHYGPDCLQKCPGLSAGAVCGGHGVCSDGLQGTGLCICLEDLDQGMWTGLDCGMCQPGWYGAACALACPAGAGAGVCSGHGACNDGTAGTGACACEPLYGGAQCERTCPSAGGLPCAGIGRCDGGPNGTFTCDCTAAVVGRWAGPACARCAAGWLGVQCNIPCPADAGVVCSGRGTCRLAAPAAVCDCDTGYAGPACGLRCPGPLLNPCNGHGTCAADTGTCACAASAAAGHWEPPDCAVCVPGWSGFQCNKRCPLGPDGRPCAGGLCAEGQCVQCPDGLCGAACDVAGDMCSPLSCDVGFWGANCTGKCPGGASVCGGHGQCLNTRYSTGQCVCEAAFTGPSCGLPCNCSGHGSCIPTSGGCLCDAGFAGHSCALQCPADAVGRLCAGHGNCSSGAEGDGACACSAGYVGVGCTLLCPGFEPATGSSSYCNRHGTCHAAPGGTGAFCRCVAGAATGNWVGEQCSACLPGWHGPACRDVCGAGRTEGQACVCHEGYARYGCHAQCPAHNGAYCGGHGRCDDGASGTGLCSCAADWYGPACATRCVPAECHPYVVAPPPHPACDAAGACVCQRNATGHWGGADCNACARGWWGPTCARSCACNGHGSCGQLDGACDCWCNADDGCWSGLQCEACLDGYLAPLCKARNVQISRSLEFTATLLVSVGSAADAFLLVDAAHGLVYTGSGQPLLVSLPNGTVMHSLDLGAPVQSATLSEAFVEVLVAVGNATVQRRHVQRGRHPRLVDAAAGPARRPVGPGAALWALRGRAMDVLSTAIAPDVEWLLAVGGRAYQLGFAPGLFWVDGVAIPVALDELRSAVAWEPAAGAPAFVLGGRLAGQWQLLCVPVGASDPSEVSYWAGLLPGLCGVGGCVTVGQLAAGSTALMVAVEHQDGVVLAKFVSLGPVTAAVHQATLLAELGPGNRVEALAVDPVTASVYLAVSQAHVPSYVYRVNATSLVPYGVIRLLTRAGEPEQVFGTPSSLNFFQSLLQ